MCVFLISPLQIAEPLTSELIDSVIQEPPEIINNSSEREDESYVYYSQIWSRKWTPLIPDLRRKLEMKEDEVTAHTESEYQHSGEEEVI